jgi:hypothetical protein
MVEIRKFSIDFVQRTRVLLQDYEGEYTFSNLINCTLGLIIMPYENISTVNRWGKNIEDIDDLPSFELSKFQPIKKIIKGNIIYYPKSFEILLKKIRNGIAHQNILPINQEGTFLGVRIFNHFQNNLDMEISFTEQQLKEFSLYISGVYLNENNS